MTSSFVSVVLFLAVVVSIPWTLKWWKKQSVTGVHEIGGQSKVISAVAVGPHQRVVTVEVGPEGARTWLTLGVTPQAIALLHSIPVATASQSPAPVLPGLTTGAL